MSSKVADLLSYVRTIATIIIEVENLHKPASSGVIKALKTLFTRYGMPDTLISDNGPQFASKEFNSFVTTGGFTHTTSSLCYAQLNGKEKMQSRLSKDCSKNVTNLASLNFWLYLTGTTHCQGASPSQRFLGW